MCVKGETGLHAHLCITQVLALKAPKINGQEVSGVDFAEFAKSAEFAELLPVRDFGLSEVSRALQ